MNIPIQIDIISIAPHTTRRMRACSYAEARKRGCEETNDKVRQLIAERNEERNEQVLGELAAAPATRPTPSWCSTPTPTPC